MVSPIACNSSSNPATAGALTFWLWFLKGKRMEHPRTRRAEVPLSCVIHLATRQWHLHFEPETVAVQSVTSVLHMCCNEDVSIETEGDVFLKCYYTSLSNTVGCYWLNQAAKLGSEFQTTFQLFPWQFAFLCMLPAFWWRPVCCRVVFTFRSNWLTRVSRSVKRWLLEGVCECKCWGNHPRAGGTCKRHLWCAQHD